LATCTSIVYEIVWWRGCFNRIFFSGSIFFMPSTRT
jgi:hypothetical protein